MAAQNQATQVNSPSISFIRHLGFQFLPEISLPLSFRSLHLLPEEILGTEDMPEYISSDSSLEAEDDTPEQRTSHQLRRRVRHLEHDLRDITARC
jgi:hypothetical protein